MIAPIRNTTPTESRRSAQRRKARNWIVESLLTRPETKPHAARSAAWKQWICTTWILLVAVVYLVKMLGGYLLRG